ncbi:hard surface induced protein [Colletotrichum incanum]|uniref:Hard surface induced protein n=1 Tax=Colletotrichum incanum TaxID=1573173 RepID=A0A161WNP3_COLIC|nr:hard surface induced protein [Colletotrichum incanum]
MLMNLMRTSWIPIKLEWQWIDLFEHGLNMLAEPNYAPFWQPPVGKRIIHAVPAYGGGGCVPAGAVSRFKISKVPRLAPRRVPASIAWMNDCLVVNDNDLAKPGSSLTSAVILSSSLAMSKDESRLVVEDMPKSLAELILCDGEIVVATENLTMARTKSRKQSGAIRLRELISARFRSIDASGAFRPSFLSYTPLEPSPDALPTTSTPLTSSMTEIKALGYGQIEYLNGLRGLASLAVYIWHFSWPFQPHLFFAYGLDSENNSFVQLPFIRLLYAGDAMVRVFFVLSGFVLCLGPLTAIRDGDTVTLARRIASMGIRRGFRLFIPPLVMSLFTLTATCVGWLDDLPSTTPPPSRQQQHANIPIHQMSLWLQLFDWLQWVLHSLVNPWASAPDTTASQYGSQFWTIPPEFRCSMTTPVPRCIGTVDVLYGAEKRTRGVELISSRDGIGRSGGAASEHDADNEKTMDGRGKDCTQLVRDHLQPIFA